MSSSKLTAYMQLARLSNIPTVFSNVLVGVACVAGVGPFPWGATIFAIVAASLLYVGGMALNDLMDRHIDAEERPQRPIPSGALSLREVKIFTSLCFALPMLATVALVPRATYFALALAAAIVLYNVFHKRWTGSLIFMGLCRALVYLFAATVAWNLLDNPARGSGITTFAVLLALYIIGLTVVAQKEVQGGLGYRRWLAVAMIFLPFFAFLRVTPDIIVWVIPSGIVLALWLARSARFILIKPPKVVPAILGWLAGISLLDAFFLTFTPRPELALVALACFAATVAGHRKIAGT